MFKNLINTDPANVLRDAVKAVKRAANGDSNDREMDVLRDAIGLAQARMPKHEAQKSNRALAALADGDSNDAEIEGLQGALESALRFWPEIDADAIDDEVQAEDDEDA